MKFIALYSIKSILRTNIFFNKIILLLLIIYSILYGFSFSTATQKIAALEQTVLLLGSLGDSLAKMVQSLRGGIGKVDAAASENTYIRLRNLSAMLSELAGGQRGSLLRLIDYYLSKPNEALWYEINSDLATILPEVHNILERLRSERSDFVLETPYRDLFEVLMARSGTIKRLIKLPPPKSEEELALLRQMRSQYIILVDNLEKATLALNAYLKKEHKP